MKLNQYWTKTTRSQSCNEVNVNLSLVSVRSEKKPGKGRPIKIYALAAPVDEIISYYEDKIYKKSQVTFSAIKKLKGNEQKYASSPPQSKKPSNMFSSIMAENSSGIRPLWIQITPDFYFLILLPGIFFARLTWGSHLEFRVIRILACISCFMVSIYYISQSLIFSKSNL